MTAKPDIATLFKVVKAALLSEWDPIDISDNPHLADEYDSYVPEIVRLVAAGRSPQELADHLKHIEKTLSVVSPEERRTRLLNDSQKPLSDGLPGREKSS